MRDGSKQQRLTTAILAARCHGNYKDPRTVLGRVINDWRNRGYDSTFRKLDDGITFQQTLSVSPRIHLSGEQKDNQFYRTKADRGAERGYVQVVKRRTHAHTHAHTHTHL